MKKMITALVLVLGLGGQAFASAKMQKEMVRTIDAIGVTFNTLYAPAPWKKEYASWELEVELDKAKLAVTSNKDITVKEFQLVLRDFFHSTKDYHVGFSFYATESATLPLTIRGAEGRYFIVEIDRKKLSEASFPFKPGDEVVSFGGEDIATAVKGVRAQGEKNVDLTDQAIAELVLTRRRASRAVKVPRGPVSLGIIKKGAKSPIEHQLVWDYTPEKIGSHFFQALDGAISLHKDPWESSDSFNKLSRLNFVSEWAIDLAKDQEADSLWKIGGKKSFVPALGKKIWESDEKNPFDAYIYLNEAKKFIGYIRIPSYGAGEKESVAFKEIMKKFDGLTEGLVIDEINNPGGSVFYLYSLVSMLTDQAMSTPRHRMSISQKDVLEAIGEMEKVKKVTTDEEAQKYFGGKTLSGYPVNMTFATFYKEFLQFTIDEWMAGRTLTTPYFLYGVDKINPHPEVRYTKPVLLLTNELDFSGGDFFPGILQDNKRVKILGTRTAGAGGYVLSKDVSNLFGLSSFSVTGSLAIRASGKPLENLGVTPDVEYKISASDMQNGFEGYKKEIVKTIDEMIK
ncbi:MAG: protease-like activity factor CPAF [Bacteriovoracaceae bacterium]|jgi:hypothetical protein|nr:protease-like activity factor CPAF [Bacteriovoracaceae bacterium]